MSIRTLNLVRNNNTNLPPVPPSSTQVPYKNRTQFKSLNLHRIFVYYQFHNQKHLNMATNASIINSGLLLSTIASFGTILNTPKGEPIKKRRNYLDKVYTEILFGDCVALGGHCYALLLVDVATRQFWIYGMSSLSSTSITSALEGKTNKKST